MAEELHPITELSHGYGFWADDMNYTLCKKSIVGESEKAKKRGKTKPENIGKVAWYTKGYYSTFHDLIRGYFEQLTREKIAQNEEDNRIADIEMLILDAYKSAVKEVERLHGH